MEFEWDEDKRLSNIETHGVDFRLAAAIFSNLVAESMDERKDYGEIRFIALGHINEEYLTVVYTVRNEKIRIISAWKAGENGRRRYQKLFS